MPGRRVNCGVVGDNGSGKTAMIKAQIYNKFSDDFSTFDTFVSNVKANKENKLEEDVEMHMWTTLGSPEAKEMREALYQSMCDVLIICFSVAGGTMDRSIKDVWEPEVREHCPNRPILLVGTQTDLRENGKRIASLKKKQQKPVTKKEGERLAKEIGAIRYMECSALTQSGIRFVFQEAARAVLERREPHVSVTKRGLGFSRAWCGAQQDGDER